MNGRSILVLGCGRTGVSIIEHFINKEVNLLIQDDNKDLEKKLSEQYKVTPYVDGMYFDLLCVSPGVPNNRDRKHQTIRYAEEKGIPITSDVEIFQSINPDAKYIGITGTNGKSTTTALVGHILQKQFDVQVCGNIGIPVLSIPKADIFVMELSSFQIDLAPNLRLDIAICLNITPDHLDRYSDMDDYAKSKSGIFTNSLKNFISSDYEYCKKITKEHFIRFSTEQILDRGISIIDSSLYVDSEMICKVPHNQALAGKYNAENVLVAIATCLELGMELDVVLDAVNSFNGLPHRNEIVHQHQQLTFINDSKATNSFSAKSALSSLKEKKILWIIGGICKDDGIESLSEFFSNIQKAYLIGTSTEDFYSVLSRYNVEAEKCFTLENALLAIKRDNPFDGFILLSPSCSSLDQWRNFEERGNYFTNRVKELWSG